MVYADVADDVIFTHVEVKDLNASEVAFHILKKELVKVVTE
jgi:hypothetical protein